MLSIYGTETVHYVAQITAVKLYTLSHGRNLYVKFPKGIQRGEILFVDPSM